MSPAVAGAPRRRTPARRAVTTVFFLHGLLFASWAAHIPHIRLRLGLSNGTLGIALLGAPVGSLLAMAVSARALPRLGSRRLVALAVVGYGATGPFVGLAGSAGELFAALAGWGFFQGALDMAMNTQAIAVERRAERVLMPGFHGAWSLGAFAGAGLGTMGVALGIGLTAQLTALGAACALTGLAATRPLLADPTARQGSTAGGRAEEGGAGDGDASATVAPRPGRLPRSVRPALLLLGALAIADLLCEGAAADWSSVYLRTSLGAGATVAGLGYTLYACTMAGVRLAGNRLVTTVGARRLVAGLAGLATVGFGAGLGLHTTASTLVGFACLGAGLAAVIPAVFSAAGRLSGAAPGVAVSSVAAVGWIGFVGGPPLIGQLAGATSLRAALVAVPVLTAAVAVGAGLSAVLAAPPRTEAGPR